MKLLESALHAFNHPPVAIEQAPPRKSPELAPAR